MGKSKPTIVVEGPPIAGEPAIEEPTVSGDAEEEAFEPRGTLQRVHCTIFPDRPEFYVWYNVGVAYEIRRSDYEAPGKTPVEKAARKMAMIVHHFEGWNFPNPLTKARIPEPRADDWETWRPICGALGLLTAMAGWIMNDGLSLALDQALGNLGPDSTEP